MSLLTPGWVWTPVSPAPVRQELIKLNVHYRIPLKLFNSGNWAALIPSARAVLPVIGVYTNKGGRAYPGMKLISKLSGYSSLEKVRQGIGFLRGAGLLEKQKTGRHNEYHLKGNALWLRGSYFPIYKDVIRKGYWARLTPCEKAVFLTLAVKATINDPVVDRESNQHGIGIFWPSTMARLSGIVNKSFYTAVNGLIRKGWIMAISESGELLRENQPAFYAKNGYIVYQKPITMQKEAESIFSEKTAVL